MGVIEDLQTEVFPNSSVTELLSESIGIEIPYVSDDHLEEVLKAFYLQNMK
jgi:hypothetical protein